MHRKVVPDIVNQQKIELLPASTTVRDAARNMTERHIGAVLVGNGARLQGIFTERDVLTRVVARGMDPDSTTLEQVMTPNPDTVGPNDLGSSVLERMRASSGRQRLRSCSSFCCLRSRSAARRYPDHRCAL